MDVIPLTQNQFRRLTPFSLERGVLNTEGQIYYLDKGDWQYVNKDLLFKKPYVLEEYVLANKLVTINNLNSNVVFNTLEELVFPKYLVAIDGVIQGFSLENKRNTSNLGIILNSKVVPMKDKLLLLKKVGILLSKVHDLQKNHVSFVFGDLHPYNFLVDKDKNIFAIDLDSAYFGTGVAIPSYYLSTNKYIPKMPNKYFFNQKGFSFPDLNSDLFCYNMMLINTIANKNMNSVSVENYFEYLSYLSSMGFSNELLQSFENIYTSSDNANPVDLLATIPMNRVYESGYTVFEKKKEWGII